MNKNLEADKIIATTEPAASTKNTTETRSTEPDKDADKTTEVVTPSAAAANTGNEDLNNPKRLASDIKGVEVNAKTPEMNIKLSGQFPPPPKDNKQKWQNGLKAIADIASLTAGFVSSKGAPATPKSHLRTDIYNDKYDKMREAFLAIADRQKNNIKEAGQKAGMINEQLLNTAKIREQAELVMPGTSKISK